MCRRSGAGTPGGRRSHGRVGRDAEENRPQADPGAPAALELDEKAPTDLVDVDQAGQRVGRGQSDDGPPEPLDDLFETIRVAHPGAHQRLTLEEPEPLRDQSFAGRDRRQCVAKRPEPELKGDEDVGRAQRAFRGDQPGAAFDGGEKDGGIVGGQGVDQVVDQRPEHGVVGTVQRDRLGGCHQFRLHERPLSNECRYGVAYSR